MFAGFNQLWRRNIRKAEKLGVTITPGDRADLAAFHPVYVETAHRDHFTPRGLAYFERMWDALNANEERLRLYLAHHDGHVAAATIMVTRRQPCLVLLRRQHDRRPRRAARPTPCSGG